MHVLYVIEHGLGLDHVSWVVINERHFFLGLAQVDLDARLRVAGGLRRAVRGALVRAQIRTLYRRWTRLMLL